MGEKLSFFPSPYPDEDFRSLIVRYHIRTGNKSFRQTKIELMNQNSIRNLPFPRNINFLLDKLSTKNFTTQKILNEHTIFPLISPFIPSTRLPPILDDINFGESIRRYNAGNLLGKKERKLLNINIHYCPLCISDDYNLFGEVYAHRMHQLSFFRICPIHNTKLIYKCPICGEMLSRTHNSHLVSTPFCSKGHKINDFKINTREDLMDLNLYDDVHFIMNLKYQGIKEKICYHLEQVLIKNGYVWNKKVNLKRLFDDLVDSFSSENIKLMGLSKEYLLSRDVQYSVFSRYSIADFRFFILLCRFLAGSVKDFFEIEIGDELINSDTSVLCEVTRSYHEVGAARQEYSKKENIGYQTLDWEEIDYDLVHKIRVAAEKVYKENPPRLIKKGTIIRMLNPLDKGRIRRRGNKDGRLPKSNDELLRYEEGIDKYLIRRLPDHIKQLEEKGCKNISIKTLKAHRKLYKECSQETIKLLQEELLKSGYGK